MKGHAALLTLAYSLMTLNLGLATFAQETERDAGQATVLLRGIVSDEQGKPIIGASIEAVRYDGLLITQTKSIEGGAFLLRLPNDSYQGSSFLRIQDESKRLASLISGSAYNVAESKNVVRAVLKPLHETQVTVIDRDGMPLADASVRLYAEYGKLEETRSDSNGQVQFKFPADAKIDWIVAYKSGYGFDYYENYDSFPTEIKLKVPAELELKLDGFTKVTVKVVDT